MTVNAVGQLSDPKQFANIIVRSDPDGGFTKLGDVARIELGAEDYSSFVRFDGNDNVVGLGVVQLPTANALSVSQGVIARLEPASKVVPARRALCRRVQQHDVRASVDEGSHHHAFCGDHPRHSGYLSVLAGSAVDADTELR